jgi:hypothetical protein
MLVVSCKMIEERSIKAPAVIVDMSSPKVRFPLPRNGGGELP